MKAIVFALCLVGAYAATLTNDQKTKLDEYKKSCFAETGADPTVYEAFKTSIKQGVEITTPLDPKMNCFAACMLKKIGIMKPDGSLDETVARSKIPKDLPADKVDQIVNTCKTQIGKDTCEVGGKVMGCLYKSKAFDLVFA